MLETAKEPVATIAYAIAGGVVAASGIVRLWLRRTQDTQQAHGEQLRLLTDRVTRIEASQQALTESLDRIESMVRALDGRMATMAQELGRVAGKLEARA